VFDVVLKNRIQERKKSPSVLLTKQIQEKRKIKKMATRRDREDEQQTRKSFGIGQECCVCLHHTANVLIKSCHHSLCSSCSSIPQLGLCQFSLEKQFVLFVAAM
jgi:bacterioferritin-associated ferredoxin